ncbi:MAG: 30S ribosomal protein S20 [Alteromonas sp.]|nr:30S ribosomal protein S20 [Alteromonas sp.]
MPIIKSAKKRVRVAHKQSVQNAKTKRSLKSSMKAFQSAVLGKKGVEKAQNEAQSAIDTAVKKGVITKNKAARTKSQLNAQAKAANGGKRTATKKATPAKKPAAKKTTKK